MIQPDRYWHFQLPAGERVPNPRPPLKAGQSYFMFIYGDRTNTITTSNPKSTVLKEAGTVLTGDQVYNTQFSYFHL